jgi:hypothetical protein
MQSGFFPTDDYHVGFIDAVFEKLTATETLKQIRAFEPHTVLSLIGHASIDEDAAFLSRLKSDLPRAGLYLSGDMVRFKPVEVFKRIPADGLITDFSSTGLADFLAGNQPFDLILRNWTSYPRSSSDVFDYPLPHLCTVKKYDYRLPFFEQPSYYSLTTGFGCPFRCSYCNTHLLGYRARGIEPILRELSFAAELGFKSLYIRDATFLFDKERTLRLFAAWEKTGLKFQWICFTRPELVCQEIAEAASHMGCRLMMVGVETFDEECLKTLSRDTTVEAITNAFSILRQNRIPSAAEIIVGLESRGNGGRKGYENRLKQFVARIDPDYVSLNIFSPRPGIPPSIPDLKRLESDRTVFEMLAARICKQFYLRPTSLFRKLSLIGSSAQLAFQLRIAANLLFKR